MAYIVCAEEIEGRWIAHVPDLPGCYAAHDQREAAIGTIPMAVERYLEWCTGQGLRVSGLTGPMVVSEVVRAWRYEDDYEVNAFFAADRPPLLAEEMPEYERLLLATRRDLEQVLEGLDEDDLHKEFSGENWPIVGIVNHVALAEQWYFDRMGIALPTRELPTDPLQRLLKVREHTLANLRNLAARIGVVALSGETWSARKVMRRTLWHERDHTEHISKLKSRLN